MTQDIKVFNVAPRILKTKNEVNRLRKNGILPGVVYGKHIEPLKLTFKENEFLKLYHEVGYTGIIQFKSEDDNLSKIKALVKDIQLHPVTDKILHVDFYAISEKEKLRVEVPIELVGTAKGIKEGGVLEHHIETIEVECLPTNIPETIKVDITNLGVGDSITVGDIEFAKGVKPITSEDEVIVVISHSKVEVASTDTQEEELTSEETNTDESE